ncbi:MAG: hypothetical protein IJT19_04290 [Bacteroidaceae bacterium]|nr:hypothetical protein [Bacteroidaceae bacterium]
MMKQRISIWVWATILVICGTRVMAQTNLAGRTYYNANIMAEEMNKLTKDADKEMAKAKTEAIAKFEKEKGRKPNEAEMAEIDKKMEEARQMLEAIRNGMSTKITLEFRTEKDAVMRADMKISDEALKAAGVGWAKRKMMKAALAMAPSTMKATYTMKGNLVIMTEDGEQDTLRLSDDGKYLYGKFDKTTNFKLTRTK